MSLRDWSGRRSLVSVWNESIAGAHTAGGLITTWVNFNHHGQQADTLYIPVPRACRVTRYSFILSSTLGYTGTVTVGITRSTDYGVTDIVTATDAFALAVSEGGVNGACGDLNVLYDECDAWRPTLTFSPGIGPVARMRINYNWELR